VIGLSSRRQIVCTRWHYATIAVAAGILGAGGQTPVAAAAETLVSLTFDDGYSDQARAVHILDRYGLKGTFYVISGSVGRRGYLRAKDLRAMQAKGHEIGGHTVSHPHLPALSLRSQWREICGGRDALMRRGLHPVSFAYPYGEYDDWSEAIVRACYQSGRGAWGMDCPDSDCTDTIALPPSDPDALPTPDAVTQDMSVAQIEQTVVNAERAGGGWVPLQFHHVCSGCDSDGYSIKAEDLDALAAWLEARASRGTVVATVAQVMGRSQPPKTVRASETSPTAERRSSAP
jgi:peptidoglycan/xylan/chitin deacetylase (PgdA/CDA1 family)